MNKMLIGIVGKPSCGKSTFFKVDINQPKPQTGAPDNWITEDMQGVPEGQRDDTCTRLAGYYISKGIHSDIVKVTLYPFA